jgi:hypothetical protein
MTGRRRLRLLAAALLAMTLDATRSRAGDLHVEVRSDGTALVDGQSESLRSVLDSLCTQAGATLRYDAPDEPIALDMSGGTEPLERVVERLLRGKSYTTRFAGDPARLAELHVVGPGSGVVVSAPPDHNVVAPAALLEAVFGRTGGNNRETAVQRLVETVRNDPQRLNNFLNGDLPSMQKALARYPEAPRVLRAIMTRPEVDGVARARIEALLAGLD